MNNTRCFFALCLLTLSLCLGACGEDSGNNTPPERNNGNNGNNMGDMGTSEPDEGGQAPEAGPALEVIAGLDDEVTCAKIFECCSADEQDIIFDLESVDEMGCVETQGIISRTQDLYQISLMVKDGKMGVDQEQLEACAEAFQAIPCTDWDNSVPYWKSELIECQAIFTPGTERGEPCQVDQQCITGSCQPAGTDAVDRCADFGFEGERCIPSPEDRDVPKCEPSSTYCDFFTEQCESLGEVGALCISNEQCRSNACEEIDDSGQTRCVAKAQPICAQGDATE